jgi:hypothetical protein
MGYTSDSEFNLEKRVQITNEIPPTSMYHLLPSGLKREFWKYLVGTVKVEDDVEYTEESQPKKIVNGSEAPEYGPEGSYHSLEVDGVLLPEIDLFLHEIYRYLNDLYPDHPDYEKLLTPIEINEAFYSAAAIIGYVPDYKFLEIWSTSLSGFERYKRSFEMENQRLAIYSLSKKVCWILSGIQINPCLYTETWFCLLG